MFRRPWHHRGRIESDEGFAVVPVVQGRIIDYREAGDEVRLGCEAEGRTVTYFFSGDPHWRKSGLPIKREDQARIAENIRGALRFAGYEPIWSE